MTKQYLASKHSGRSGCGAEKGRRVCKYVLNSTSQSPVGSGRLSCQISANQREAETSANVNKHWKTRAKGNDVITNVISANQHFASKKFNAYIQIPQTQLQTLLPFLAPPPERPAELAHRQTKQGHLKIKRTNSTARTARIFVDTRVCVCWTVSGKKNMLKQGILTAKPKVMENLKSQLERLKLSCSTQLSTSRFDIPS